GRAANRAPGDRSGGGRHAALGGDGGAAAGGGRPAGPTHVRPHPTACRCGHRLDRGDLFCLAAGAGSPAAMTGEAKMNQHFDPAEHLGTARLSAQKATVGYDQRVISQDLSVEIPDKGFTVIVGANACGKSTLLRALSRLIRPSAGEVMLDGKAISQYPAKEVARRLGLLPQTSIAPEGITVADLVARGRYPHQKFIRQWSVEDEKAVMD